MPIYTIFSLILSRMNCYSDQMKRFSKHHISAALGNLLEWYDYGLYGYFANVIGQVFFPNLAAESLLASFAVFAVGFLSRPLGALLFGHIGDLYGRQYAMKIILPVMFLSTFSIGFLPTFDQIGWWAPALLIIARLCQGLSVGGQFMGSVTYLVEFIKPNDKRKSMTLSYTLVFSNLGFLLASLVGYVYPHYIQPHVSHFWQWRLPFLTSIFTFIMIFNRTRWMPETPEFLHSQKKTSPQKIRLEELFKRFPKNICFSILLVAPVLINYYLLFVFLISYLTQYGGMSYHQAMLINTLGLITQTITLPAVGWLSDVFGHKRTYCVTLVIFSIAMYLGFLSFQLHHFWINLCVLCLLGIIASGMAAPSSVLIMDAFPTRFRFRGSALSVNIGAALFAGTTPMLLSILVSNLHIIFAPSYYMILWCLLGFVGVYSLRTGDEP